MLKLRNILLISTSCIFMLVSFSIPAETTAPMSVSSEFQDQQRNNFIQAEQAIRNKNYAQFRRLKASLNGYPLMPYLQYEELRRNVSLANEDQIRLFLYEYNASPLEARLRKQWLYYLAARQQWTKFIEYYKDSDERATECLYRTALLKTGNEVYALSRMDDLWLTGSSAPQECNYVFDQWHKSGHMSSDIIFERIELATYRHNIRLAKSLAMYLPVDERHWVYEIEKSYYQPENILQKYNKTEYNKYEFIVLKHALLQLTRKSTENAAEQFIQLKKNSNFCSYDCDRIENNITYHLLNNRNSSTSDYFKKMDLHNKNGIHRAVFVSMLEDDWKGALSYIDKLDQEDRLSEEWLYWRARILYKLGNRREANSIYRHLAGTRNYYGFLAADFIDTQYNLESRSIELSEADYQLILNVPGIQRARELILLGRVADARREWTYAVQDFSDEQLYIAAHIANQWLWHDRAIYTIANTAYTDDLDIRFPMPFKNLITLQSEENDIDPAWVYALIRQESIFMHDARSGSGALGLMQLMPATARQQANRLRKRVRGQYEILQPQNNITLGTYYLKRIYNQFDQNMILATAAYNAGPTNVKRWLPSQETDWDIWVETIPFNETRNYVQNVASFRVIYSNRLGLEQFRLNRNLKAIPAREN